MHFAFCFHEMLSEEIFMEYDKDHSGVIEPDYAWLDCCQIIVSFRDSQGLTGILTAFRPWKWRSFELCCVISIRVTTSAQNTLTKHGDQNRNRKVEKHLIEISWDFELETL